MSDTITQDCNCCGIESDCIDGLCESCSAYNYKLQKQVDLLTLGLLQEKNKVTNLLSACNKAHDNLLCLHVCDQDRQRADNLRNEIKEAIAKAERS